MNRLLGTSLLRPFAAVSLTALLSAPAFAEDAAAGDTSATVEKGVSSVSAEEEDAGDAFPLGFSTTVSSAFGNGVLAPGYTRQPTFAQTLTLAPSYKLPEVDWLPKLSAGAKLDVSIQWLSNFQTTVYDRIPRLSDFFVSLSAGELWKEELTGIKVSGGLSGRLPLSLNSRRWNVLGALGANTSVSWSTAELDLPIGDFSISYSPAASIVGHVNPNPTLPCDAAPLDGLTVPRADAAETLERLPMVITREGEIVNGKCVVGGRRIIGYVNQTGSIGWSLGKHSAKLSLGWQHRFFAPLVDAPSLSSPFSSPQSFDELSTGSLVYSYEVPMESFDLPVDTDVSLSAGLSSSQPAWDAAGRNLRFPWWDFVTPANNFSAAFFELTVGI